MESRQAMGHFLGKVDVAEGTEYSLTNHLQDVEEVAMLLSGRHIIVELLADHWSVGQEDVRSLLAFLGGIHDLGKFTVEYQKQCDAWLSHSRYSPLLHHTDAAQLLLVEDQQRLAALLGLQNVPKRLLKFLTTTTGHHGFASHPRRDGHVSLDRVYSSEGRAAAWDYLESVLDRLDGARRLLRAIAKNELPDVGRWTWPIAGYVVLADWLGSNTTWFPIGSREDPARKAERAILESRVLPPEPASGDPTSVVDFDQLWSMQHAVCEIPLRDGPGVYVLEAETGRGKTEAALILAKRLLDAGHGSGIYWALPTQATSNSMYTRVVKAARRMFPDIEDRDIVLAHGGRHDFETRRTGEPDREGAGRQGPAWLADNLKRALLAPVGVGTLDQALLGVLGVKHQCLRLLGLTGKILIVDEVHAFDTHELRLLEALIDQHRATGGSVILLSATLPSSIRSRFLGIEVDSVAYPSVTWCHEEAGSKGVQDAMSKAKRIEFLDSESACLDVLERAAGGHKVGGWIRNTVDEAGQAYERLTGRGVDAVLIHSRFTAADRHRTEERVEKACGGDDRPEPGFVVVATQVLEQSLDIDFDVLVTDLCPADLVVQRMGRLHRHRRDKDGVKVKEADERGEAILHVHVPDQEEPSEGLFKAWSPGSAFIYPHHGRLWLTWQYLRDHPRFADLKSIREFVEHVYAADADQMPACFRENHVIEAMRMQGREDIAGWKTLRLDEGYQTFWEPHPPEETATRLGGPTRIVVVLQNGKPIHGDWRESRIRLSEGIYRHFEWTEGDTGVVDLDEQLRNGYIDGVAEADAVGYTKEGGLLRD